MKVIDVYSQYFNAKAKFNDVPRKGARVFLTATSDAGMIKYEISVTFFPYRDPEDFAVSYDAVFSKTIYEAKGRRSKKREAEYLKTFRDEMDAMIAPEKAKIYWDKPIRDAVYG